MKCPHCEKEIEGRECPHCYQEIPEESVFCLHCGSRVEEMEEEAVTGNDEWDSRQLCSDGTCIGIIGSDGKCKECGKPYTGEAVEEDEPEQPEAEKEQPAEEAEPVAEEDKTEK